MANPTDRRWTEHGTKWPKTLYPHGAGREWSTSTDGDKWKDELGVEVMPVPAGGEALHDFHRWADELGLTDHQKDEVAKVIALAAGGSVGDRQRMKSEMLTPTPAMADAVLPEEAWTSGQPVEGQLCEAHRATAVNEMATAFMAARYPAGHEGGRGYAKEFRAVEQALHDALTETALVLSARSSDGCRTCAAEAGPPSLVECPECGARAALSSTTPVEDEG